MLRTHNCGELRISDCDKEVELCGWVNAARNLGSLIFISLRDRYGITQVVLEPDTFGPKINDLQNIHRESVIRITGKVSARPENMRNSAMTTGDIEVYATDLELIADAAPLPMEISDEKVANEETRLRYRYLDLRRPSLQANLRTRHNIAQAVRNCLSDQDFLEVQTPLFVRSTPEGARDFVVPSRNFPGKFYALPQSPQLYKQLLMISGVDRYFQLAPCFRDEDLRADRQLVHTQIDMEMSFCDEEDIYTVIESIVESAFKAGNGVQVERPFKRMSYKEAMDRYGSDKPDLRFDMEMQDITDVVSNTEFAVFKSTCESGGKVRGLVAKGCAHFTRKEVDELTDLAKIYKAKGLVTMKVEGDTVKSSVSKFLTDEVVTDIKNTLGADDGDLILIVADTEHTSAVALGQVRKFLGKKLNLISPDVYKFLWVTDFPMFEWNEDEGKWDAMHHIFTMPRTQDLDKLESDPGSVLGRLYDLVLNGVELGSGSIRISQPELQKRVMNVIGMDYEEAEKKFGFLLRAYQYGGPVHGGFAIGFDRLVATILGLDNLKDVIAFPQNAAGVSPVDDCPNEIEEKQWRELHIKERE